MNAKWSLTLTVKLLYNKREDSYEYERMSVSEFYKDRTPIMLKSISGIYYSLSKGYKQAFSHYMTIVRQLYNIYLLIRGVN